MSVNSFYRHGPAATSSANPRNIQIAPFKEIVGFLGGQARLLHLPVIAEPRGGLLPFDFAQLPFEPRHSFVVKDVAPGTVRGGHSHRHAEQLLICLAGAIDVRLRYQGEEQRVTLNDASGALLLASNVWAEQTYCKPDTLLLVFASEPYDANSYNHECP